MAILKLKNKTTGEWEEIQAIKGPQGPQGPQGVQGPQGIEGPTGPIGNGISSIEKTSTSGLVDTYTITYTNGSTTTFDVSNGNGIDRIEKTATVGNKDTYTIYFTNGSTTTYEVSNGEVTREELEEEVDRLSMIYNAFPTTTGEGEEPSINGTAEVPFKEIGLKGNTSQEGTPTPDTPIPVNVVTGDNTINICGKNLFNGAFELGGIDINNGNNDSASDRVRTKEYIPVQPNTEYTISGVKASRFAIFYDSSKVYLGYSSIDSQATSGTITTLTNTAYIRWYVIQTNTNVSEQLELGTTATTYAPYQSASYPISLGDIELCKIGDYQDRIYKDNGKWYLNKQIGKVVFTGENDETWNISETSALGINRFLNRSIANLVTKPSDNSVTINILSNNFVAKSANKTYLNQEGIDISSNGILHIYSDTTKNYTAAQFKKWLSTHNTTVYYPLANPTTTEITDTTLIEQLDNLEKAYSYDTQTNISQTNQDKPFIISYEAILSLKNVLNSLETRIAVLETE